MSIHKRMRLGELIGVFARSKWLTLKSSVIGTAIGILPGTGPTIASWIAYGAVSRGGKGEAELGSGVDRGIIASESANNAVTGGALVPLLTLGIPGDTVTAVLIGALLIQGIDPGPFFIVAQGDLFALILLILIASNSILLILGLGARRYLAALLKIPPRILAPIVAVLCAAGGFAISNSPFDVGLIAVLGVFAYVLMRFGVPMPPLVLGLVLGPIIERNLRDALTVHQMDFTVFVTRPISGALLAIILVTIGWTIVQRAKSKRAR